MIAELDYNSNKDTYLHLQPVPTTHLQQAVLQSVLRMLEQPQLLVVGQPPPDPVLFEPFEL